MSNIVKGSVGVSSIGPGESHLGEIGGNTLPIIVTPTITAGGYSANDIIGGKIAIANAGRVSGGSGLIQSITVIDKAKIAAELEFYLFSADLAGTYADNAAEAISAADALLNIGHAIILASDYKTLANYSIATIANVGLPYKCGVTSLYLIVRTTAGITYAATSNLQFRFGLLRD
jgi:hypothetical protein